MSLHRRDAKRDANEAAIVEALRAAGATLARASGPGQAFTCSRCGKSSGPAVVDKDHDTTNEIAAWAERHRGGECGA